MKIEERKFYTCKSQNNYLPCTLCEEASKGSMPLKQKGNKPRKGRTWDLGNMKSNTEERQRSL